MSLINKIFSGRLNLDDHPYRIGEGDYIDGLNITRDSEGLANDKIVSNIVGNQLVAYTLPAGINKVIGGRPDKLRSRYYYFVWNNNGNHLILYYDADANAIVKIFESKTDSAGVDILNFTPSKRIYNINIIHRDEGDLMNFIDSLGRPSYINVTRVYAPWVRSYLDVAKAPPSMIVKCTYENDTTVTVNNLRNSLFQFKYRFVYDDFQKSVYSSGSAIPLPFNPFLDTNDSNKNINSRISTYFSTGDPSVQKIELWGRQITTSGSAPNDTTGEYFLIQSLDKTDLSIPDNSIYKLWFYNDGSYTYGDLKEQVLLFDWVPLSANAQESPNGNTLIYGGITEGYDKVSLNMTLDTNLNYTPPVSTFNGLLFFASQNGVDSDPDTNTIVIYLTGTGTNDGSGNPITLNNSKAFYIVDCALQNGTTKKFQYQSTTSTTNTVDILNGLKTAALAQGFSFVSQTTNTLTLSQVNIVLYTAQVLKVQTDTFDNTNDVHFSYAHQSKEEFALQYFDEHGVTNGATLPVNGFIDTLSDSQGTSTPQIALSIFSRPPIWGKYFHVLRSLKLTYDKHEFWVSNSTYSGVDGGDNTKYAFIGIDNMNDYNANIQGSASGNVPAVGYSFTPGDRIRFLMSYPFGVSPTDLPLYDYEILALRTSILSDGEGKTGLFLQIKYPTPDISSFFDFGGFKFQNYKILIYNYVKHASSPGTQQYFEFGRQYSIGQWGTSNAFHIGAEQTQTTTLSQPAIINLTEGDFFYRYRNVPISNKYSIQTGIYDQGTTYSTIWMNPGGGGIPIVDNGVWNIKGGVNRNSGLGHTQDPQYADTDWDVYNESGSPFNVRIQFTVPVSDKTDPNGQFAMYVKIQLPASVITYNIISLKTGLQPGVLHSYTVDFTFSLPAGGKMWLITYAVNMLTIGSFENFLISIVNNISIPIIESTYSDKYAIITNSNNRPSVYDENARQTYYPTLDRFSLAYQEDTNINNTNRFYPENQDEYDRAFGDIMRFHIRDRALNVYQKFKVGRVPILTQIVEDVSGNPLQANSSQLINKIAYYQGDYGIGDVPESLAWNNFADYFVDDYRGVVCRLSFDGIKPISIEFSMNAFFVINLKAYRRSLNNGIVPIGETYMGDPTVYGAFDAYTNKYVIAMESINRYSSPTTLIFQQSAYTISFDENKKAFESFYSYAPEWIDTLGTLLMSFKVGALWTHNSDTFCSFYGVQYGASIEGVFNANALEKKTFQALTQEANIAWDCPEIETQSDSYGVVKQQSNLLASDFDKLESMFHASFFNDTLSIGGLIDGDKLKGNYIIVKFSQQSAPNLVILNMVSILYIDSQLTAK